MEAKVGTEHVSEKLHFLPQLTTHYSSALVDNNIVEKKNVHWSHINGRPDLQRVIAHMLQQQLFE